MHKLVLLRHGQTTYNKDKRFCGWTDVNLTEQGINEAHEAGKLLKRNGFLFDVVHTNTLKRCIETTWIVLKEMDLEWIPVQKYWRLNERHYGALQSKYHEEVSEEVGEEQVFLWRRSFDNPPPMLSEDDSRFPGNDPRYANVPRNLLPKGESLKMTLERVKPYIENDLYPAIRDNKKVLLVASHNSLRALAKALKNISDEDLPKFTIPTGKPYVFELDDELHLVNDYYLEDK